MYAMRSLVALAILTSQFCENTLALTCDKEDGGCVSSEADSGSILLATHSIPRHEKLTMAEASSSIEGSSASSATTFSVQRGTATVKTVDDVHEGLGSKQGDSNRARYQLTKVAPWDGVAVLGADGTHRCVSFAIDGSFAGESVLAGGQKPQMCLREYSDAVSDSMKAGGMWADCPSLASWWTFLPDRSSLLGGRDAGKLYMDVGTNIGACLLPMVARPDVPVAMGFEPNPKNLFYLTNSILANPHTKDKIHLYPFALGNDDETLSMYTETGNKGNTVVGHKGPYTHLVGRAQTIKLDEILMTDGAPPYIHLMKMDAQGFEVNIMKGGSKLFASGAVNAVKFELAPQWLLAQGTSPKEYMNMYLNYGFHIHDPNDKTLLSQRALSKLACERQHGNQILVIDLVAVHLSQGESPVQKAITC